MKNVRTPRFLNDVYRDLRDRRLLIPAAALVVALIAVPAFLSSSSSTQSAAPLAPSGAAKGATAAQPAVLARELGNTDYAKRLQPSETKNPFRRQFAIPKVTSTVQQSSLTESPAGSSGTASTSTTPAAATTASPPQSTQPAPAASPSPAPQLKLFAYRVSVAIGPAGALVRRDNVKRLTFLPYDSKPMVAFLGVTEDRKSAIFLVDDDVSSVEGDGHCIPGRNSCKFLELKLGDKASLAWAPQGDKIFNLKLLGIKLSPLHPRHGGTGKTASLPALGPDG
jgi:hypothetical protein